MFTHFGFSPPNLRLPGEQNCTQNGRTERKGDGKLRAPVRPLAYKRLPRQPALSQTTQGNAARPTRGRSPNEHIPVAKQDILWELSGVPDQTPWELEMPKF